MVWQRVHALNSKEPENSVSVTEIYVNKKLGLVSFYSNMFSTHSNGSSSDKTVDILRKGINIVTGESTA
jgi:hypothetical protein